MSSKRKNRRPKHQPPAARASAEYDSPHKTIAPNGLVEHADPPHDSGDSRKQKQPRSPWGKPIVWFNGLLVLIGIAQSCLLYKAHDTTRTLERARVQVSLAWIELTDGRQPRFAIRLTNRGRSAATMKSVAFSSAIGYTQGDLPLMADGDSRYIRQDLPGEISPSDVPQHQSTQTISATDVTAASVRSGGFFLWGYVSYLDAFGAPHSTHFGFEYMPARDEWRFVDRAGFNWSE